jgi:transposase
MHRHELTDEQWRKIESLLPRHGRRSNRGDRNFVNAVLWLMKTGSPWRDRNHVGRDAKARARLHPQSR